MARSFGLSVSQTRAVVEWVEALWTVRAAAPNERPKSGAKASRAAILNQVSGSQVTLTGLITQLEKEEELTLVLFLL